MKLCFYVPADYAEGVKEAVFQASAGQIGDYRRCCFQLEGQGQFEPMEQANPFLGQSGQLEKVKEIRVEMLVDTERARGVVQALKESHPYEEPAWDLTPVITSLTELPE